MTQVRMVREESQSVTLQWCSRDQSKTTALIYSFIFSIPVGFFWQTVENEELQSDINIHDEGVDYDTQNTMSLVYKRVYR